MSPPLPQSWGAGRELTPFVDRVGPRMRFPELRGGKKGQNCLGRSDTQVWDPRTCRDSQACLDFRVRHSH